MAVIRSAGEWRRWTDYAMRIGFPLEVSVEKFKPKRTSKANAFLFRAVYQPLVEKAGFTKEDWHEYFCQRIFGEVAYTKPGGEVSKRPKRTTTTNEMGKRDVLKGDAFADFVTQAEAICAEYGVFVEEQWNGHD